MKKITREQWKQWGKWRREGAAAKKACYRFVFDPAKHSSAFVLPKTLDIVTAACYQVDNKTEEEKEKQA
jgi:hypothetical protein